MRQEKTCTELLKTHFSNFSKIVKQSSPYCSYWNGVFINLIASACNIFNPIVLSQVLNNISGNENNEKTPYNLGTISRDRTTLFTVYGTIWFFANSLKAITPSIIASANTEVASRLALAGGEGLYDLTLPDIEELEQDQGTLAQRLVANPYDSVKVMNGESIRILFTLLELAIVCSLYYDIYGWPTIVGLLGLALSQGLTAFATTKASNQCCPIDSSDRTVAIGEAQMQIQQMVSYYKTIRLNLAEKYEVTRFSNKLSKFNRVIKTEEKSTNLPQIANYFVSAVAFTLVIIWAGEGPAQLDSNDFVLITTYILQILYPVMFLNTSRDAFARASEKMSEYYELMKLIDQRRDESKVRDPAQQVAWKNNRIYLNSAFKVEFKNVTFEVKTQEGTKKILDRVSFTIEAGKKIAIVGESGSGKSTLVKLMLGFYKPSNEDAVILINDLDMTQYAQNDLFQMIGIVPQDVDIFAEEEGLYYNLFYGKGSHFNDGKLIEIDDQRRFNMRMMCHFVQLSKFYNQAQGQRINKEITSGGERQRIGLARMQDEVTLPILNNENRKFDSNVEIISDNDSPEENNKEVISNKTSLLRNVVSSDNIKVQTSQPEQKKSTIKRLYILDEATSALDMVTEKTILLKLNQIYQTNNATMLLIGHRLTSIKGADKIIYLKNGRILEEGTEQELLDDNNPKCKGYFKLLHKIHHGTPLTSQEELSLVDEDINDVLNLNNQVPIANAEGARALSISKAPSICFKDLSFMRQSFEPGKEKDVPVLRNINLNIQPGTTVAIVGQPQISIITKLLLRFYNPTSGEILVNDVRIDNITSHSLRSCICVLPHDLSLFNASSSPKKPTTTDTSNFPSYGTFKNASARDFDNSNLNADVLADEKSSDLSKKMIFILDEFSSSLDQGAAKDLYEKFNNLSSGKTTVYITNKLDHIMHVNHIYYIEGDEIVESGTYDHLLSIKGKFYQRFIAHSQKLESQNKILTSTATTTMSADSNSAFFRAPTGFSNPATTDSLATTISHSLN